jgi:hypothetical protein
MGLYAEAPLPLTARLVRDRLASDSELAGFFGARIVSSALEEADLPIRYPTLAVVPLGEEDRQRRPGGWIHAWFVFLIRGYLPVPSPASEAIARPGAPTLAGVVAAGLTGTFRYRLTEVTPGGESFAGDDSTAFSVTLVNETPTLAMPAHSAGGLAFRVWRTSLETPRRYNLCGLASKATWTDTVPDAGLRDELAPDSNFGSRLQSHVESALTGVDVETLPENGVPHVNAALRINTLRPTLLTKRNLMVYGLEARWPTLFNPITKELVVGT